MIERIFNTFIPDEIAGDIVKSNYAKNLIGACIISIFASPVYAILQYYIHFHDATYVIIANECLLLLSLLILKYFRSLFFASMLFIASLECLLCWLTYHLGGIYSATAYWLILPPFIATFIGGLRLGYLWCIISTIVISALYIMEYSHYQFPLSPITDPLLLQYLGIFGLNIIILSLAYFYEIAKKSTLERLRDIAYRDILTDLPNRMAYAELLNKAVKNITESGIQFSIFFIDIDNFKKINAIFSQDVGNILLIEIAQRIKRHMSHSKCIARVGGDEFKIILEDISNEVALKEIADILLATLKIPYHIKNREINITVSIGIATSHINQPDSFLIDRYSDAALRKAKRLGGNNYQYFTENLEKESILQIAIEHSLPHAILNNEFDLNFQLIFEVNDPTKIAGFEVLLRWNHPTLGEIPPSIFIPIAEKIDMVSQLGLWALTQACQVYSRWQRLNLVNDDIPFAVNISAQQLYEDSFIDTVHQAIQDSGITPTRLLLELTETAVITDQLHAVTILQKLKETGIHTVIDDFGAGYTSLSYLTTLPVSRLKIDKAFITAMVSNPSQSLIIIQSIIELAHKLNLKVVSEGVETAEQLNYLKQLHCDYAQGYYLSKPLDLSAMQAFLEKYKAELSD